MRAPGRRRWTQRKLPGTAVRLVVIAVAMLLTACLILVNQSYPAAVLHSNVTNLVTAHVNTTELVASPIVDTSVNAFAPVTVPSRFKIVLSRQPYVDDPKCENFTINLYQPNTFELTALISYPGSGNTWLRHLIEFSTGIFTGSVYDDDELYGKGFYGEKEPWYSGSTLVQKLHVPYSAEWTYPKGILLFREPYEAIVSFAQFLEGGHTGAASPSVFKHTKWQPYVMGETYKCIKLAKSWLESPARLLVVHYEHLLENATREVERICAFVKVPCRYIHHPCFQHHLGGHFHRRKQLKPVLKFDYWVQQRIDDGIDYLSQLLVRKGHDPLPVNLYKYYKGHRR